MSLIDRIGEHLLCVAIDLNEAKKELEDARIKVNDLALKHNNLIMLQQKLRNEHNHNSDSSSVPDCINCSDCSEQKNCKAGKNN